MKARKRALRRRGKRSGLSLQLLNELSVTRIELAALSGQSHVILDVLDLFFELESAFCAFHGAGSFVLPLTTILPV